MKWSAFTARRRGRGRGTPALGRIRVRIMNPVDGDALHEVFGALSPSSRYLRFHAGASRLTAGMERALLDLDGVRHRAVLAESREQGRWRPIGIARHLRSAGSPAEAEVAIEVIDDWQGRGVGLLLLRRLSADASEAGITRLVGHVLPDNRALLGLIRRHFTGAEVKWSDGTFTVAIATGSVCGSS